MKKLLNNKLSLGNKIFLVLTSVLLLGGTIFAVVLSIKVDKPIYIQSAHDFNNIKNNLSGHYIINEQTFLNDEPIVPIGTEDNPFTGTIEATSKVQVMASLCNITFDNSYIKEQYNSDSDEVNIGMFAYNSGVIRGILFYNIILPDLSAYIESNKVLNFGIVAANNSGWINKCSISGITGSISSNNVNGGSFAGINNGEIKVCETLSEISFKLYGSSNVGSFVGLNLPKVYSKPNKPDLYIWYCNSRGINVLVYRKEYDAFEINYGGLIGLSYGGTIIDCCVLITKLTVNNDIPNCLYVGGIIGCVDSNLLDISNCYVKYKINNNYSGLFGGIFGKLTKNSIVNLSSLIVKPEKVTLSNNNASFGIVAAEIEENVKINVNNVLYFDSNIECQIIDYSHCQNILFEYINLESLYFDTSYWTLDNSSRDLILKVKIW